MKIETKFSIGEKVRNIYAKSEILTIAEVLPPLDEHNNRYMVEEYPYWWNECELLPYASKEELLASL